MEKFRKLTSHDLAFGIGRKATEEELRELLDRAKNSEKIESADALKEIEKRLAEKNIKKAS